MDFGSMRAAESYPNDGELFRGGKAIMSTSNRVKWQKTRFLLYWCHPLSALSVARRFSYTAATYGVWSPYKPLEIYALNPFIQAI